MKVTKITAKVRYSRDIGGSCKSVELVSEATVDDGEKWQFAHAYLYSELSKQLKSLWAIDAGSSAEVHGSDGSESPGGLGRFRLVRRAPDSLLSLKTVKISEGTLYSYVRD